VLTCIVCACFQTEVLLPQHIDSLAANEMAANAAAVNSEVERRTQASSAKASESEMPM
jgi:hypothetical protein